MIALTEIKNNSNAIEHHLLNLLVMNEIKTVAPINLREYSQNQTYGTQKINQRIPMNMMERERERETLNGKERYFIKQESN